MINYEKVESGIYDEHDNLIYTWNFLKSIYQINITSDKTKTTEISNLINNILQKDNNPTENLTFVFGDDVNKIGQYVFYQSLLPKKIYLKENVIIINPNAFCECKNLEEIIVNSKKLSIEQYAFLYCENLKNINFINSNASVNFGHYCFAYDFVLKNINLNNNYISSIGSSTFINCTSLKKIVLTEKLKQVGAIPFYKYSADLKIVCKGEKKNFQKICGFNNLMRDLKSSNFVFINEITLDDLINQGYNLRDANKILKEQSEFSIENTAR